ncbi:MAG: OadG family transporter subunit [Bacillota bacterium]|nr:OadG family transporter subunit [Bacillota bacterium]
MNLPFPQALPLALAIPYEAYMLGLVIGIAVLLLIVIILLVQTKQALIAKPGTATSETSPAPAAAAAPGAAPAALSGELIAVIAAAIAAADEELYASADDVVITGITPLEPVMAGAAAATNWDAPSTAGFRIRPRRRV